jgi:hypothetical protein
VDNFCEEWPSVHFLTPFPQVARGSATILKPSIPSHATTNPHHSPSRNLLDNGNTWSREIPDSERMVGSVEYLPRLCLLPGAPSWPIGWRQWQHIWKKLQWLHNEAVVRPRLECWGLQKLRGNRTEPQSELFLESLLGTRPVPADTVDDLSGQVGSAI